MILYAFYGSKHMDIGHAMTFHAMGKLIINFTITVYVVTIHYTYLCFNVNNTGAITKCKSLIMKVYMPGFIVLKS